MRVGVVDERSEIGGSHLGVPGLDVGVRTDILDGCPKAEGMMMLVRSMSPELIAVDEIGGNADMEAMENAISCGCRILATVHGSSLEEIRQKPLVSGLLPDGNFRTLRGAGCAAWTGNRASHPGRKGEDPMLKITGACLILCSAAGIGASFSGDLKRRVRELRILKQLVYMLQGEIRYARLPLPGAFCHVSVRLPVPFGTFLSETADELKKADGRTLGEVWKMEEAKHLKGLHLVRADLEQLESLGEVLGYLDAEMQLAAIRLYLEQLENSIAEAQEHMGSRQKLYQEPGDRRRCIPGDTFALISQREEL